MHGVTLLRLLCTVAVLVAICVKVERVIAAKPDICAGGSGIVKASRSASLGARILTRCGRNLVLKYTLKPEHFYTILTGFCVVTRLCYAHIPHNKDMNQFRRQVAKCIMDYSKWLARSRPEVVGEDIATNVEELTADIESLRLSLSRRTVMTVPNYLNLANCVVTQIPKDQDTMLGIVRYLRMFFFTA